MSQGRTGNEASQAMLIAGDNKMSQLATCLQTAHNFLLSQEEAKAIFEHQIQIVEDNFDAVCTEAELTEIDKQLFWQRQFLKFFFYNAVAHSRFCPLNY